MAATLDPIRMVQEAVDAPGAEALEKVVRQLDGRHAAHPATLYAKAELERRRGDLRQAAAFSTTAVSALFQHRLATPGGQLDVEKLVEACMLLTPQQLEPVYPYFLQLGELLERTGLLHGMNEGLARIGSRVAAPRTPPLESMHSATAFALLGFNERCDARWSERVMDEVALPWLEAAASRGDLEIAMALENLVYRMYLKRQESQAWFKAGTARFIPRLAERVRAQPRPEASRHRRWRPEATRRVGFFLHNASRLAHVVVLLETLQAVHAIGARNYEFTVFLLGGRDPDMVEAFKACGVRVRHLGDGPGGHGFFDRLRKLEDELKRDNYAVLFWVSLVTFMAIAFPRRIAPVQGWLSMKYHACEVDEIDVRFAVENVVLRKRMDGHEWRTFGSAARSWVDPAQAEAARALRATFPADAVVAASIGREEKLDSPAFLSAVCELLRAHPNLHFLWTGRVQRESIQGAFDRAGVADRARFVGWVNTKLYAQAIDLFLDSFPFPCGFTLKEAMAAGKPAVLMRTAESLETGVPGAITPLVEGSAEAPAEARERLRSIFSAERDFDLYACAADAREYVALASRLIGDAGLRDRMGAANRAFIEAFLCSPGEEARKFLDHLDQVFDREVPRETP